MANTTVWTTAEAGVTTEATGVFQTTTEDPVAACLETRYWSYFLASSLITFFAGLVAILAARLIQHFSHCPPSPDQAQQHGSIAGTETLSVGGSTLTAVSPAEKVGFLTRLKWQCESLMSGQTVVGRIIVSLSCVLSIGSLIIYLVDASRPDTQTETCNEWTDSINQQVDFAFNIFFMLSFIIRMIAANDKLTFWLEVPSFVDYFTIPPSFVGIALDRQWLGLRFLRALRLMSFPDILQYLNLLRTSNSIRLAQLVCIFASVWLAGAGFIHLVETTGDPFVDFTNAQNLTYWEAVYFALVTMSTVGYGDIYCHTTIGRAFMVFFIMGSLAMFASFVPEIVEIFGRRQRYGGFYDKPVGVRHIIICGHIVYESVHNFLKDFLHEDRENQNIKCLFLDNKQPDLELEALFKRHFTQVVFFKGSVMSTRDLQRVRLQEADACLILANHRSRDPDAEDAANIMRVIAAKNFHQDIRVIVQLMRYTNKAFCVNLPSWQSQDQVICLAEMKLGFMAQGCLAPGFSTLMANLFVMRSYKKSTKCLQWQDHYLRGAGMEVYSSLFSSAFHNKPFPHASELCFVKLKLLLVAVVTRADDMSYSLIRLNPGQNVVIDSETKGFFVCQSEEEAKRVLHFCVACHGNLTEPEQIRQCLCPDKGPSYNSSPNGHLSLNIGADDFDGGFLTELPRSKRRSNSGSVGEVFPVTHVAEVEEHLLVGEVSSSSSDTFHSQQSLGALEPSPRKAIYTLPDYGDPSDSGHSSSSDTVHTAQVDPGDNLEQFDSTGLFHHCKERVFEECILSPSKNGDVMRRLKNHVVLCLFNDGTQPEVGLCNFVMPLRASTFRQGEIKTVVLVGDEQFLRKEWPSLAVFPDIYVRLGSPLNRSDLRAIKIDKCHMCVILTANESLTEDLYLVDKEAILCSLNIKTMSFQALSDLWKSNNPSETMQTLSLLRSPRSSSSSELTHRATSGACIPMLTELANDYNAQFLDQDDEDDPDVPLYMTQPFCCGRAFAASVLDTLMSTTYFNSESLSLIRMLITGGFTAELDQILAEGQGLVEGAQSRDQILRTRQRCTITMLPLEDGPLQEYSNGVYGGLFVGALRREGILCLGLYRQLDPRPSLGSYNRYIITNPPAEFGLFPSDKVYCLQQFSASTESGDEATTKL